MMPFPQSESELKACGYRFKDKALCRGCQANIEWWETPAGKLMPLDPGSYEVHWATCPKAAEFKKKK